MRFSFHQADQKWAQVRFANEDLVVSDPVHDICFSASMGKRFHHIALATDNGVKLLKIYQEFRDKPIFRWEETVLTETKIKAESFQQVHFNLLGTQIAAVTQSGELRIFVLNINNGCWFGKYSTTAKK